MKSLAKAPGGAKAAWRLIQVLSCFAERGGFLRARDVSSMLGIPRSTAYRLLNVLREEGYCRYDGDEQGYRLGLRILDLARIVLEGLDLRKLALPYMELLRSATGEGVSLNVRDGHYRVCIEKLESTHELREVSRVGTRVPLHAGASGKVLLAYAPDPFVEEYLAGTLVSFTEHTITDPDKLRRELVAIRSRGWSISRGERIEGVTAVAAPVFGANRSCVASLSLSGPFFRMEGAALRRHIALVKQAAGDISRELGAISRVG